MDASSGARVVKPSSGMSKGRTAKQTHPPEMARMGSTENDNHGRKACCLCSACHTDLKLTHLEYKRVHKSLVDSRDIRQSMLVYMFKIPRKRFLCLNGCILTTTHDIRGIGASCFNLLGISEALTSDFTLVRVREETTAALLWWKVF